MPIKTAWIRALLGLAALGLVGLAFLRGARAGALPAAPVRPLFFPAIERNHDPARASPTPTVGPSATPTATQTEVPTVMIYGWVTLAGEPSADVTLDLGLYEGDLYAGAVAQTSTEVDGSYSFSVDAGLLSAGQAYGVRYENTAEVAGRLLHWYGYPFAPGAGESTYPGGDFDIADIALLMPDTVTPLPLPVTFAWSVRDPTWASDDVYQLQLVWRVGEDETIAAFVSEELLDGQYVLQGLPAGFEYGRPFEWWASVWGAYGYGRSLRANWVAFAAP